MRTRRLVLSLALLALAAPAGAAAKLPQKGGKLIVPGSSVGGVKLGMTPEQAVKKWGKGGSCDVTTVGAASCRYEGSAKNGRARFDIGRDGKVSRIVLTAGLKADGFASHKGPITKWHTKKGIKVGSALRRVLKVYPKATYDGNAVVLATGKRRTFFSGGQGYTDVIDIAAASEF
jgi:hypothetical protein